ncbi:hypothetical protein HK096_009495 [Nowakowskiella sp. JEL0078]|nr:hypothetical protein HK096_009495 [Nowakowskiella sp. JEL0078]
MEIKSNSNLVDQSEGRVKKSFHGTTGRFCKFQTLCMFSNPTVFFAGFALLFVFTGALVGLHLFLKIRRHTNELNYSRRPSQYQSSGDSLWPSLFSTKQQRYTNVNYDPLAGRASTGIDNVFDVAYDDIEDLELGDVDFSDRNVGTAFAGSKLRSLDADTSFVEPTDLDTDEELLMWYKII